MKKQYNSEVDATGEEFYTYNQLGALASQERHIIPQEQSAFVFKTEFEYDIWNRLQNMTYSDGEIVYYNYNEAGVNSLSWFATRNAFDAYESYDRKSFKREAMVSQSAQRLGYDYGLRGRFRNPLGLNRRFIWSQLYPLSRPIFIFPL